MVFKIWSTLAARAYLGVPLEEQDVLHRTRRAVVQQRVLLASQTRSH